jgi:type IX secretion system PorP/SprF family membrane protein
MIMNKHLKRFFLIFCLAASAPMTVLGQQDPEFSQFMYNKLYYNPAYAGVEGLTRFDLLLRSKWTGYSSTFDGNGGAPTTEVLSISSPIFKINSGFGVYIMNDNLGNLNNLGFQASYAYHFQVKDAKLSVGLSGGFYAQSIDFSKYRPTDPNDPLIGEGKETNVKPDMGFGVHYQGKKLYLSVGAAHLLSPSFNFGSDNLRNTLEPNVTFMAGYDYNISYNIVLTPSLLVQTDFNKALINFGAIGTFNEKFWGGITYKYEESVAIILGIGLLKDNALEIGYAFDYIVHSQDAKQPTSNEIRLSYALPANPFGGKKVVRTPRFRH